MPQKGCADVPGFGTVRTVTGIHHSGSFRTARIIIDFGDSEGLSFLEDIVSRMNRVRVRHISGEPSAMSIMLAIDCRGVQKPQDYARKTRDELVRKLVVAATQPVRSRNSDYKSPRSVGQRGGPVAATRH